MSAPSTAPRLVKKMDLAVWQAIRQWGENKDLELAEAIALLWELQQGRERLDSASVERTPLASTDGVLTMTESQRQQSA
jgi:hypothetical protein